MVHPLLFLEFFRKLLAPLHIPEASADAISYTWLVILLLLVLSLLATSAIKSIPGKMQNFMETVILGIENMIVYKRAMRPNGNTRSRRQKQHISISKQRFSATLI